MQACGVCRTDLHIAEGELPPLRPQVVPGHMVVGVVDELGPGATRFARGDRVGIAWLRFTCGKCRYCKQGSENLCPYAQFTGYHANGGYAEFATVPENFAYAVPEALDAVTAALCSVPESLAFAPSAAPRCAQAAASGSGVSAPPPASPSRSLVTGVAPFMS